MPIFKSIFYGFLQLIFWFYWIFTKNFYLIKVNFIFICKTYNFKVFVLKVKSLYKIWKKIIAQIYLKDKTDNIKWFNYISYIDGNIYLSFKEHSSNILYSFTIILEIVFLKKSFTYLPEASRSKSFFLYLNYSKKNDYMFKFKVVILLNLHCFKICLFML